MISMQEIFKFDRERIDPDGNVVGEFKPSGIRPKISDHLQRHGIDLGEVLFSQPTKNSKPNEPSMARTW
ncbi:MAG: hypothetical protein HKN73_11280 [Gemmatimonadetes bacterium]|nr:hypothetical protein [Gemmatimonadota bacterium]